MSRNEAKEIIFPQPDFFSKALSSLSFIRCNPDFTISELQLFLRRIGRFVLTKSLSNFNPRENNESNQPIGDSNPDFQLLLSLKLFAV